MYILKDGKVVSGMRNVQINQQFTMPSLNLTKRWLRKKKMLKTA